jgi:hypothetical protein
VGTGNFSHPVRIRTFRTAEPRYYSCLRSAKRGPEKANPSKAARNHCVVSSPTAGETCASPRAPHLRLAARTRHYPPPQTPWRDSRTARAPRPKGNEFSPGGERTLGADQIDPAYMRVGSPALSEPQPKSHVQHAQLRTRAGRSGANLHAVMAQISNRIRYLPSRGSQILPWRVAPETAVY